MSNNRRIYICDNNDFAINEDVIIAPPNPENNVTFDMTTITFDSDQYTFDNNN